MPDLNIGFGLFLLQTAYEKWLANPNRRSDRPYCQVRFFDYLCHEDVIKLRERRMRRNITIKNNVDENVQIKPQVSNIRVKKIKVTKKANENHNPPPPVKTEVELKVISEEVIVREFVDTFNDCMIDVEVCNDEQLMLRYESVYDPIIKREGLKMESGWGEFEQFDDDDIKEREIKERTKHIGMESYIQDDNRFLLLQGEDSDDDSSDDMFDDVECKNTEDNLDMNEFMSDVMRNNIKIINKEKQAINDLRSEWTLEKKYEKIKKIEKAKEVEAKQINKDNVSDLNERLATFRENHKINYKPREPGLEDDKDESDDEIIKMKRVFRTNENPMSILDGEFIQTRDEINEDNERVDNDIEDFEDIIDSRCKSYSNYS